MTNIVLVETAAARRVRKKAEEILAHHSHSKPDMTILCTGEPGSLQCFREIPGVKVISLRATDKRRTLTDLNGRTIDSIHVFWTGEKKYRWMKVFAFRIRASSVTVQSGDGGEFTLTWKAFLRHFLFRCRHPLPTDHWEFYSPHEDTGGSEYYSGERVLLIQSAHPLHILRALERWSVTPLFHNPRYTLFCRDRAEILQHFHSHPMLFEIRTHSETSGWWTHLRQLRKERFDAVTVFLTGDPSYWKIKYFAFMLRARHKVVFNENNDCFFFSWESAFALLNRRLGERSRSGTPLRWPLRWRPVFFLMTKIVMFPFRFIWLLLIWIRLRSLALWAGRADESL